MARATLTRWRWPPERLIPRRPQRDSSPCHATGQLSPVYAISDRVSGKAEQWSWAARPREIMHWGVVNGSGGQMLLLVPTTGHEDGTLPKIEQNAREGHRTVMWDKGRRSRNPGTA